MYKMILFLFFLGTLTFAQAPADSLTEQEAVQIPADSLAANNISAVLPDTLAEEILSQPPDTLRPRLQPTHVVRAFTADSAIVNGSDYYSFGDVADKLTGVYYYHPGSMGQQNYAALFAGRAGKFILAYDGVLLNDLFTGLADLNVIPTENLGNMQIVHSPQTYLPGVWQNSDALQVSSLNIAALPIRSQVGYRNGANSYDDVDVRVGIKPSMRTELNFGATARSTNGTMTNADYYGTISQNSQFSAYNADVNYDYQLNQRWSGHYILHYYKGNVHFPHVATDLYQGMQFPMSKKENTSQAISLHYLDNFELIAQKTSQSDTWHGQDHKVVDAWYDADLWRVAVLGQASSWILTDQAGVEVKRYEYVARQVADVHEYSYEAFSNLGIQLNPVILTAGLTATQFNDLGKLHLQPQFSFLFMPTSKIRLSANANRKIWQPSYHARFGAHPLYAANANLKLETVDKAIAALEFNGDNITANLAIAQENRDNMLATVAYGDSVVYENFAEHSALSVSGQAAVNFLHDWKIAAQGNYFSQNKFTPANQPDYFTRAYLQYHHIFFQNDLNLTVRLGASLLGPMKVTEPFWADFSTNSATQKSSLDPYVNATIIIHSVTWFLSFENFTGQAYSRVYPYLMPSQAFRFGFMWNFVD